MKHDYCMLLMLGCLIASSFSYGSEEPQSSQPVKLVTGDNYFPYAYDGLPEGGWSVAVIAAVFAKMEQPIETEIVPWNRGLMWTEEGQYLGTYPYVYSNQRNEKFLYSEAINKVPARIYVARNSGITEIGHLQGKRLCIPHGYSAEGIYAELLLQWRMVMIRAQNGMACIRHVEKGWSDVGLTNGYMTSEVNRERFGIGSDLVILAHELDPIPLYFVISRSYPDAQTWINRFNTALKTLIDTGEKQQIDEKYRQWLSQ
ncbi:substrate-binding periplasmic protein [Lacimicrobium alkaliphilum]|uniref:Solute-binding protein family 3/N-terminal domain-containing protein n=1 Tax=Lacimicrobium alkaliphilum TaxID=1526571 RepID=A0ABQ1RKX3_9ALTE|nr:transporter substrate-binding domain-containing protein [Lacimicrobium alkaliphilum]GGD73992.1 hypothetical protein GCM10011357_31310 [Lacimicrobium alkaliphilum]